MGKQPRKTKYPDEEVEVPEDATPKERQRLYQHNYEVREKRKTALE